MSEPVFRPGSEEFFSLLREWRSAWFEGRVNDDLVDPWLLETNLGDWGLFEGVKVPLDFPMPESIAEAEYKGRQVSLGKPFRVSGGGHKFAVYVRDPKTKNVKKVQFGAPGLSVKLKVLLVESHSLLAIDVSKRMIRQRRDIGLVDLDAILNFLAVILTISGGK